MIAKLTKGTYDIIVKSKFKNGIIKNKKRVYIKIVLPL